MASEDMIEDPGDTCIRVLKRMQADLVILVASRKAEKAPNGKEESHTEQKVCRCQPAHTLGPPLKRHIRSKSGRRVSSQLQPKEKEAVRSPCDVILQSTTVGYSAADKAAPRRPTTSLLALATAASSPSSAEKAEHCAEAWGRHGSCAGHVHSRQKRGSNSWQRRVQWIRIHVPGWMRRWVKPNWWLLGL
uniref:Uncharacterized protein n=1 Tax=Oryza rufipogon TaxID=4529 RepID=A0A0E0RGB3_ORYRU